VLGQYVAGYQRLDPAAIRAVWPSAPGDLQKSFNDLRSYELQLQNQQITVRGDTATVSATRRIRQQPKAGRAQERSVPSTFILRRTGGSWVIDSIR
jgi:ketosteroid isomerase-like protein